MTAMFIANKKKYKRYKKYDKYKNVVYHFSFEGYMTRSIVINFYSISMRRTCAILPIHGDNVSRFLEIIKKRKPVSTFINKRRVFTITNTEETGLKIYENRQYNDFIHVIMPSAQRTEFIRLFEKTKKSINKLCLKELIT